MKKKAGHYRKMIAVFYVGDPWEPREVGKTYTTTGAVQLARQDYEKRGGRLEYLNDLSQGNWKQKGSTPGGMMHRYTTGGFIYDFREVVVSVNKV